MSNSKKLVKSSPLYEKLIWCSSIWLKTTNSRFQTKHLMSNFTRRIKTFSRRSEPDTLADRLMEAIDMEL